MSSDAPDVWLVGVDGCPAGWMAAFVRPDGSEVRLRTELRFSDIISAPERPEIIAIDIPIGLPERAGRGGRPAENAVRPLLGARQSSVFSVPSRAAVYARDYQEACRIALATSDPPRKVSRQLFLLTPKIREVDQALRADPALGGRVFEAHPELAFWQMNGARALSEPKRVRSQPYAPGLALRRALLASGGMPGAPLEGAGPAGARADDVLDALACAVTARRLFKGVARRFPDARQQDAYGMCMAIWA